MGAVKHAFYKRELVVPADATTLEGFRRWRRQLGEDAPKVHYIDGDLWFDMSPQSYRSHLPVVSAINGVLWPLAAEQDLGRYFMDGGWITDAAAGLSNEPDGFLVLWDTFTSARARLSEDSDAELVGRPDMVLEVLSASSVGKDRALERKYAQAGVREYWQIDARRLPLSFRLLQLEGAAYVEIPPNADGFRASRVWERAFRLRQIEDRLGQPDFRLDARP